MITFFLMDKSWFGEIAQYLRVLAALPADLGSADSLQPSDSSSKNSHRHFWPLQAQGTHVVQR